MKKGVKYSAISLLFVAAIIIFVGAAVNKNLAWEPESEIKVSVNGERTLEEAINSGLLSYNNLTPYTIDSGTNPVSGHNSDEIWVSVNGNEMTLKEALQIRGMCGTQNPTTTYSENPATETYHFATDIEVTTSTGTKSLQDAINAGEVLNTINYATTCYQNDQYYKDSCNVRGNLKQDCGSDSCTSWSGWGNYYCSIAVFQGDVVKRDRTRTCYDRGCSGSSCFSTPSTETDSSSTACGSGYSCNSGDCYGGFIGHCTFSFSMDDDTCPGSNENSPYSCSSGYSGTCVDIDETGDCGSDDEKTAWRERTINCYSP